MYNNIDIFYDKTRYCWQDLRTQTGQNSKEKKFKKLGNSWQKMISKIVQFMKEIAKKYVGEKTWDVAFYPATTVFQHGDKQPNKQTIGWTKSK